MKTNINFKQWLNENPSFEQRILKENSKWGRIVTEWNEIKDGKTLKHLFAISINLNTGDCYLDCRRRKIWAKQIVLVVARPLQGIFKTLYHLSMVPVVYEIFQGLKGNQSAMETFQNSCKSLADIVRTPVYTVAMMITGIAAIAITPLARNTAYDFREWHGRLEQSLFWGEKHTDFTLALCFQSIFNVIDFEADDAFKLQKNDTEYATDKKLKKTNNEKIKEIRGILKTLKTNLKENEQKFNSDEFWALKDVYEKLTEISNTLDKTPKLICEQKRALRSEIKIQNKIRKRISNAKRLIEHLNHLKQLLKNEKHVETRLTNFARRMIRDRRFNYTPFYQLFGKLDPDIDYKSAYFRSHKPQDSKTIEGKQPKKKKNNKSVKFNTKLLIDGPVQTKVNFSPRSDTSRPKNRGYQKENGQPLKEILGDQFYDQT